MDGYSAPGTESYGTDATATGTEDAGWYGDGATQEAATEQQGFSIPTTGQTNGGGGPMRQGRGGGSRYNPMSRGKPGGGDAPANAAAAEKNELGYIIFAYNIGYQTDESQLHSIFAPYGSVAKVNVIQDFATGQGKGFGFVTMSNATEAETAVNSLNGSDFNGNSLQIRFKSPKGQTPSGGRGGRGGAFRGSRGGGFRGMRGGPRGGGFRGGRGAPRGGGRGRGRGAYSSAPSAYDSGYGGGYSAGYDSYGGGYSDPSAYGGYDYSDPYAAGGYAAPAAPGAGYTSYGTGGW